MFHVGQKVVCIHPADQLVMGNEYTILAMSYPRGDEFLKVIEGYMHGWYSWRFRPLIERKTDTGMAVLREILDRESVEKPVKVRV